VSIPLEQVYGKSSSMVHRQIADETILVPIRRDVADLDSIYALGGVAPRVWQLIDGQRTLQDVVACIVQEYEVEADVAKADVLDLVAQLDAIGALNQIGPS
jgi:hypothetical protein